MKITFKKEKEDITNREVVAQENENIKRAIKFSKMIKESKSATILVTLTFSLLTASFSLLLSSLSNGIANGFSNQGNGSLWIGGLLALGIALIVSIPAFILTKKSGKRIKAVEEDYLGSPLTEKIQKDIEIVEERQEVQEKPLKDTSDRVSELLDKEINK